MITITGRIVTPTETHAGTVRVEDGRIAQVGPDIPAEGKIHDFGDALVVPGFIDVHMHGITEFETFDVEAIVGSSLAELRFGTTGFLPTVASLTEQQYLQFGKNVRQAQEQAKGRGARILGGHFEGPFINPANKGGMDATRLGPMDVGRCQRYIDQAGEAMKLMTLSPELPGSEAVISLLRKHGCVISLGHSRASEDDLNRAVKAGLTQVCHLFNTFLRTGESEPGVWKPGLVERILANESLNCEVICDMHHVAPLYVKLAAKALGPERFLAITDSGRGAGIAAAQYVMVDGRKTTTHGGAARLLETGVLIGSVLTMNRAFANLVELCGIDLVSAGRFTSSNPARAMGIDADLGSLQVGKQADIAVLDGQYECLATFVGGQLLYER